MFYCAFSSSKLNISLLQKRDLKEIKNNSKKTPFILDTKTKYHLFVYKSKIKNAFSLINQNYKRQK